MEGCALAGQHPLRGGDLSAVGELGGPAGMQGGVPVNGVFEQADFFHPDGTAHRGGPTPGVAVGRPVRLGGETYARIPLGAAAVSRLFLSHSSANNAEAVSLRNWLAAEGWNDVFLDIVSESGSAAGERWERALTEAASRCEAVLCLISRAWLDSRWCLKEFMLANSLNKRLFGVLIEPLDPIDLPPDLSGTWQVIDLASGQDHRVFRVLQPRTHRESHVTFSQEGLKRLRAGLVKAGLDPRFFRWPPDCDPNRPPYRGLLPLQAEDAGIFFGRDAPIVEALDELRGLRAAPPPRILVILGASGAGKASFLRAGLCARMARADQAFLPLPIIRPERAAISGENGLIRALEEALD